MGLVKWIDMAWAGQGRQGKEAADLERLVFCSDWANQSPNMHIFYKGPTCSSESVCKLLDI